MLGSGHFWPTCTGTGQGCTGICDALFPISTSFCIVAITCSFLIRFEFFKLLVKMGFKENKTYRNRYLQIRTLSVPKSHSKYSYVKANSCISFDHRVVRVVLNVT